MRERRHSGRDPFQLAGQCVRRAPDLRSATRIGYSALIDASALVITKEEDLFAKHGMPDVDVRKQASSVRNRDNVVLGSEKTASTARTFSRRYRT